MTTAGRRDQLVTFERFTATENDYGEQVETWGTYAIAWAAVFYGKGDERRQAAAEQRVQSATFNVLDYAETRALTLQDRLQHDGVWDIVGIAPDTPRRGEIEITATRAS